MGLYSRSVSTHTEYNTVYCVGIWCLGISRDTPHHHIVITDSLGGGGGVVNIISVHVVILCVFVGLFNFQIILNYFVVEL